MNIGLIDVDGHNFPNLALMRWVNNKPIFRKCERFEDYVPNRKR